ncbi:MAG TPA: DMT family transporter, partial [Alphaproteobacteria bacterium]|nr:DMT family transporter [Alphaproteobacteria bacterium]
LVSATIWAGWSVLVRYSVTSSLSPFDLAALRFGVASLIFLPMVLRRHVVLPRPGRGLFLSLTAGTPYVVIAGFGYAHTTVARGSTIGPAVMAIVATLLGLWLLRERLTAQRGLGIALSFAGLAAIAGGGLFAPATSALGDMLIVAAAVLWGLYTVGSRAWAVPSMAGAAAVSLWSAALYLPIYILFIEQRIWTAPLGEVVLQALYQGVATGILALWTYNRSVALLGAARGSLFACLVPVLAAAGAVPVLGEWPTAADLAGMALTVVGVMIGSGVIRIGGR